MRSGAAQCSRCRVVTAPNRSQSSRRLTRAAFSKPLRAGSVSPRPMRVPGLDELGDAARREEDVGRERPADEHVVVGVQEVLRQARDVVQLALDGVRVVGGQPRRVREEVLAPHDVDARMLGIEPRRHRRVGGDVDVADPRGEHVDAAQRVLEFVDLPVARLVVVAVADDVRRHPRGPLPLVLGVGPVDPGEDDVDVEGDVARERVEHVLERPPPATVQLHLGLDGLAAGEARAHQRVLARCRDLVVAEPPELELERGLGAVAQAADRLEAGAVQAQDVGLPAGERARRR